MLISVFQSVGVISGDTWAHHAALEARRADVASRGHFSGPVLSPLLKLPQLWDQYMLTGTKEVGVFDQGP